MAPDPGPDRPRCLIRGGGDLATGVAWRLTRGRWPVIVTELDRPLTVRQTVALSSAVADGEVEVEGLIGRRTELDRALAVADTGVVPVVACSSLPAVGADVVIDARLAKRNLDTTIDDAPLVVALGPGFTAGVDCHAIVETQRGHRLGRVLWEGSAAPDTGVPGEVGGRGADRLVRAPAAGPVDWDVSIGDRVTAGQQLGTVVGQVLTAAFDGVVRGLIATGTEVPAGLKVGDIDPRADRAACWEISDKALAVGGGVVDAVQTWLGGRR